MSDTSERHYCNGEGCVRHDHSQPVTAADGVSTSIAEHTPSSHRTLWETLDFDNLRNTSMLWLINRAVFHPRGYALALTYDSRGNCIGWQLMGDGSEVFAFPYEDDEAMFRRAEQFLKSDHRLKQ